MAEKVLSSSILSQASSAHLSSSSPVSSPSKSSKNDSQDEGAIYTWVFSLLVDAMNYKQSTVVNEAKNIAANADQQSMLNNEAAAIQFSQIPGGNGAKVGQATIDRIQDKNQQYSKIRADYENMLILARQNGQVEMTNANTYVGQVQQDASENTGLLQTLNQIGQSITSMTKR